MYDISNIVRYDISMHLVSKTSPLKPSISPTVTWGLGTSKWIWPTDLASAQGLWCHVEGVASKDLKQNQHRKPGGRFFFFRIPGSVINFFVRANKNMCSLFSTKTLPKRDIEAWVSSSCILWDVYIKESICRFFSMVAKGQSLMGDSWFADLSCWQFGTTSSIWWIFGAIRVCESELLRTRKLARKNGGMGATLLVDFGSTTVFN